MSDTLTRSTVDKRIRKWRKVYKNATTPQMRAEAKQRLDYWLNYTGKVQG